MLKALRRKEFMKKMLWFVTVIIILSFGVLGQAYLFNDAGKVTYAGKVFGETVSFKEFERNSQLTRIHAMMQYGANYNKIREFLNLESETWDRIILLHEAKRRRIRVSDDEVVKAIQSYPFFQRGGHFDRTLYEQILQQAFRIPERQFEEGVRETLMIGKLFEEETAYVTVPEDAVWEAFKRENEKVTVSYALFPADKYTDKIPYDEETLKQFYETHTDLFKVPPQINVAYTTIDYPPKPQLETLLPPQPEAAEAPEPVNSSEEEDDWPIPAVKQETRDKAMAVADDIFIKDDFAQAAQDHGLTIKETGFFSEEKPNLEAGWSFPVVQKLFQMNVGDITEPIETPTGYHILRIQDKREDSIPDFEQAKEDVVKAYTLQEAKKIAREKAQEAFETLREQSAGRQAYDFPAAVKKLSLDIKKTPSFKRGDYLPEIGLNKDFQITAFGLTEDNRLSPPVEIASGYALLFLEERQEANTEDYEKNKDHIRERLLAQQKIKSFNEFITLLRIKANVEDNLARLIEQNSASGSAPSETRQP